MPGEMVPIVMFLCIAAVAILRPITRPLGRLLEAMAQERLVGRRDSAAEPNLDRVASLLELMNSRLDMLDERVHFVERLSDERGRNRIGVVE